MPDINASSSSSPWDEPLDETIDDDPKQPTIVGDLDFNKTDNTIAEKNEKEITESLKVPENIEEKVGVKIDAKQVVSTQDNETVSSKTQTQSSVPQSTDESDDDIFWKNVYSTGSLPTSEAAKETAPKVKNTNVSEVTVSKSPIVNQQTSSIPSLDVVPQQEKKASTSNFQGGSNHLYQSAPQSVQSAAGFQQQSASKSDSNLQNFESKKRSRKTIISAIILGIFLFFAGGIYLTEAGFISLGLEKFYGFLHLEAIWGGLPANPQNALALSAKKMQKQSGYKVSGEATIIVNRGVKSDIISPIIAFSSLPTLMSNPNFYQETKAIFAAFEEDDNINELSTQPSVSSTYTDSKEKPTIEEFEVKLNSAFDNKISGADIQLKSKSKPNSKINLVYSSGKIYVKTSNDIVFNPGIDGGWLAYDLKSFNKPNPSETFWSSNISSSDFSVTGKRDVSQIIDGVRCFHYSALVNIGNAFSDFGLNNDSLSNLEIEYWIGVRDHLIRRLKIKAIPAPKSTISRIDLTLDFSDYGSEDSGYIIPATSTPSIIGFFNDSQLDNSAAGQTATSRDHQRKSDLANIAKALENYKLAKGSYPVSLGEEKISASSGAIYNALVPNYLSSVPLDPKDPTYYYGYESDGKQYSLSAVLENVSDVEGRKIGSKNIYFLKSQ